MINIRPGYSEPLHLYICCCKPIRAESPALRMFQQYMTLKRSMQKAFMGKYEMVKIAILKKN